MNQLNLSKAVRARPHVLTRVHPRPLRRFSLLRGTKADENSVTDYVPEAAELLDGISSGLLWRQTVALAASGAVLGPLCDGLHSSHDVLHYVFPIHLSVAVPPFDAWDLETCWWVPLLFGLAGIIIGVGYPVLNEAVNPPAPGAKGPGWATVLACIALFVAQYDLSGVLDQSLAGAFDAAYAGSRTQLPYVIDAVLAIYALALWAVFDGSLVGFALSSVTALGGPAIEIFLIRGLGLYSYAHPTVLGCIPSWIPWVYFAGGPAVGLLGLQVWAQLKQQLQQQQRQGQETPPADQARQKV